MRFKSVKSQGFQIFAVSGTNTISFAIQASGTARKKLLGFAVERFDPKENERYFMPGFKVFNADFREASRLTFLASQRSPKTELKAVSLEPRDGLSRIVERGLTKDWVVASAIKQHS